MRSTTIKSLLMMVFVWFIVAVLQLIDNQPVRKSDCSGLKHHMDICRKCARGGKCTEIYKYLDCVMTKEDE